MYFLPLHQPKHHRSNTTSDLVSATITPTPPTATSIPTFSSSLTVVTSLPPLHTAFIPFGVIKNVKTPIDLCTEKHRSFGFVTFLEKKVVVASMENMDSVEIHQLNSSRAHQGQAPNPRLEAPGFRCVQESAPEQYEVTQSQVKANVVRPLVSLAGCIQLTSPPLVMEDTEDHVVQWNACHALSSLVSDKTLNLQDKDWSASVFIILLLLLQDSSNFKIRIQVVASWLYQNSGYNADL
ncbi:hypothetical protein CASFOL_029452 [Castilleja foliolosa]|uniref:RRM domain-containing protein n=1 Tax=Castilleja foliolosa TaxID=1961234 RepID=A0ABD3CBL4_9LAMI